MKFLFVTLIMTSFFALAQSPQSVRPGQPNLTPDPKTQALQVKMTASEAKEACKKEGKSGAELVTCIKEKQEGK